MDQHFTTTLLVDQSPKQVFNAVVNVRGWWQGFYEEEISGSTKNLDDEFTFRAGNGVHHTKQKLIEVVPHRKIVWLVTFSDLTFIEKRDEWQGTKIIFDITQKGDKTELRFTHEGLIPEVECYDACSGAWQQYLQEKLMLLIQNS